MPYCDKKTRRRLLPHVKQLVGSLYGLYGLGKRGRGKFYGSGIYGAAEFAIFRMLGRLAEQEPTFHNINALIGVLETTKLELARRFLAPLEDQKLIGNWLGDD